MNIRTQKRGKDRKAGPTFGKHVIQVQIKIFFLGPPLVRTVRSPPSPISYSIREAGLHLQQRVVRMPLDSYIDVINSVFLL
jgi:hypothetical protein